MEGGHLDAFGLAVAPAALSPGCDDGTPATQWLRWLIVPTSGTGELSGIRGEGEIAVTPEGAHSWTIDYSMG